MENETVMESQPDLRRRLKIAGYALLAVAALIVVLRIASHLHADSTLKAWTNAQAIPTVEVIKPDSSGELPPLVLPGNVAAFYEAPIHARVSGYLKQWYADIGTHVKAGQLLATIDTPELDQQLEQAKAALLTAQANADLAKSTADRWKALLTEDAVSQQEADEKNGDYAAKAALAKAAQADVDRLDALESFKRIVAPFDGIVTSRQTDVGALINAGQDSGPELFSVADVHKLRVYVHVPQDYSARINAHLSATLSVPEYPGQSFPVTLVNSAQAVNDQSGTVLVELQTDNRDGKLKPGDYAQVSLQLAQGKVSGNIQIPVSAVLFTDQGMQVATVGPGNRVVMKPILIAEDTGTYIVVQHGLSPQDRVIDSPPDSLVQGDLVRIAGDSPAVQGGAAQASQ
ncbi:MAG TPA: efflux RND transporter periplasmic adaptor subunit [Gammaproteobacteria bacterium]|jgi:RND family efflux transporter MFP subunit